MTSLALRHPTAPGFQEMRYVHHYRLKSSLEDTWIHLNTPETFTRGQVFPYKVEFVSTEEGRPANFRVGVYNNHFGPLLNLPAIITICDAPKRRDMEYLYGASVISTHLIRPTKLVFRFKETKDGGCLIRMELHSTVRPWFAPVWQLGQRVFWSLFGLTLPREIRASARKRRG